MSVTDRVTQVSLRTRLVAPGVETRSAEGLGVAGCHDSVGAPLPAGWGPGQSPAGAQRRTKALQQPARDRAVHPVQSPAGAQRRTKALADPATYRDVHPVQRRTKATK